MSSRPDGSPQAAMQGLTEVSIPKIEATIGQRWRAMAAKLDRPQAHTCVMSLIVAVESENDNRIAFDVVNQLAAKHPLRVITVGGSRSAGEGINAWVNAGCEGPQSGPICSEEIVLQGGAGSCDRLASAVRGLLVSDLPVILWWRGVDPRANELWLGLRSLCDRVIVDSTRLGDGNEALELLRELTREGGRRTSVRDLNWVRTSPWRSAIAACFDDPHMLALLPEFDRCSISFTGDGDRAPSARALLVAGWLADRCPALRGAFRTAPVQRRNVAAGRVVDVTLHSSRHHASLVLIRQYSPLGVEAQANDPSGKQFRRWNFRAATLTEAQLLDSCLETSGSDSAFEAALALSETLL